jgi:hypothetical protein
MKNRSETPDMLKLGIGPVPSPGMTDTWFLCKSTRSVAFPARQPGSLATITRGRTDGRPLLMQPYSGGELGRSFQDAVEASKRTRPLHGSKPAAGRPRNHVHAGSAKEDVRPRTVLVRSAALGKTSDGLSLAAGSAAGCQASRHRATSQIAHPAAPWLGWWSPAAARPA